MSGVHIYSYIPTGINIYTIITDVLIARLLKRQRR